MTRALFSGGVFLSNLTPPEKTLTDTSPLEKKGRLQKKFLDYFRLGFRQPLKDKVSPS